MIYDIELAIDQIQELEQVMSERGSRQDKFAVETILSSLHRMKERAEDMEEEAAPLSSENYTS
jgi:hypothetical protein